MTRPALALALALSAAALAGCNTGFEPQYLVTDLRLLAVKAEVVASAAPGQPAFADAAPGDAVQLAALVANPLGLAPLSVRWYACAPVTDPAVPPPCLDEEVVKNPSRLADLAAQPGSGVVLLGEGVTPAPIPVVDVAGALEEVIDRARAQPTYQCSLYAEVPVVVVAEAQGRSETAVKRVRLTPRAEDLPADLRGAYVPNRNPLIAQVYRAPTFDDGCVGGTPLVPEPFPTGRTVVCATADAPGAYNVCNEAGVEIRNVHETRSWQWFVTAGEFPDSSGVGNATGSTPDFERPPGPFTLWLVLRDGRGGVSWTSRDVPAAP